MAASAATCCMTNWSALFVRSEETHTSKCRDTLAGTPAACTDDTPFALGPPANFSRGLHGGLHGGLFQDWKHFQYNNLPMHRRRTNRCWHNASVLNRSSLSQATPGDPAPSPKNEGCTASIRGVQLPWAAQGGLPLLPVQWNDSSERGAALLPAHPSKEVRDPHRSSRAQEWRIDHPRPSTRAGAAWLRVVSMVHPAVLG